VKTLTEIQDWCAGAEEEFGDPATPVCQIFARFVSDLSRYHGDEIVCGMEKGELVLWLPQIPVPFSILTGKPDISRNGELMAFGAEMISLGVWALTPSLNMPGIIHAFVVLYDVPSPVPWERLIVLAG
jgi:hypothetical protein